MKALVLSGGGSKGAFTAGVVKYLLRDAPAVHGIPADFDLAVGNSTGSLVGGPALLGDYQYCEHMYTGVGGTHIFKQSFPGGVLNILGLLHGPLNADMAPLRELISDYYLKQGKLAQLIESGKVFCVAMTNVRTGSLQFVSTEHVRSGDIGPETFVDAVVASCSVPVAVKPVQVFRREKNGPSAGYRDDLFYDGGLREFIPLEKAVLSGADDIWSISTDRLENAVTTWGGHAKPNKVSIAKALSWAVRTLISEIARGDRFRADVYARWARARKIIQSRAQEMGLRVEDAASLVEFDPADDPAGGLRLPSLRLIYPSRTLGAGLEFDPAIMFDYFIKGYQAAHRFFEKGAPLYTDRTLRPWEQLALRLPVTIA